jgi:hypothetical protein
MGNAVFLEQGQKLLLEGHLPRVLCLTLHGLKAPQLAVPAPPTERQFERVLQNEPLPLAGEGHIH